MVPDNVPVTFTEVAMVHRSRPGIGDQAAAVRIFQGFSDHVRELRRLQANCKPFGRDYLALQIAIDGLETTAYHFTRRAHFYGASGDASGVASR